MKNWRHNIPFKHLLRDDSLSLAEVAEGIATLFLPKLVMDSGIREDELEELSAVFNVMTEAGEHGDEDEFNASLDLLYDWCDKDKRVWCGV